MDIVKDNEINISKDLWKELNNNLSKDDIKQLISDAIGNNNLPLPMRSMSFEDAVTSFEAMVNDTKPEIHEPWFSRYDYSYDFLDLFFPVNRIGNISSDYFAQEQRWKCDSINSPSPYRTWNTEKFRMTLLNALWTLKVDKVDSATLRSMIGLRKYIASQFRPSTAKAVYELFGAKNVLDLSAGWGDRLAGFLASDCTESYVGVDPNQNMHSVYQDINKTFNKNKEVTLIESCSEEVELEGTFDFVFTSPPYYNIERYTQEDNQSFKRYRKLEDWLEKFLFESLRRAWNVLEPKGFMVINISDVYSNHTINRICDPMNDFISTFNDSFYYGAIGYQMQKRPNSGALKGKEGTFCEPMWVWEKI